MRKALLTVTFLVGCITHLHAQQGFETVYGQDIAQPEESCPIAGGPVCDNPFCPPFRIETEAVLSGKAHLNDDGVTDQSVQYSFVDSNISVSIPTGWCGGVRLSAGYVYNYFNWQNNPFFNEQSFPAWRVALAGFTKRVPNWTWYGTAGILVQTKRFDIAHYGRYQAAVFGKYDMSCCSSFYIGVMYDRGLKDTFVLPIFGFDLCKAPYFKASAVFPTNISLEFTLSDHLSLSADMRFIRTRNRLGPEEPLSNGIFEYRSYGGELQLNYKRGKCFGAELFVGSTFSGWIRTVNRTGTNLDFFHTDGAPYVGGNAFVRF